MAGREWTLIGEARGGHRFWRDSESPGKVAISDLSGDGPGLHKGRPDETDDGPLYLDLSRAITRSRGNADAYFVPVVDEAGEQSETVASEAEAAYIRREFGMDGPGFGKDKSMAAKKRQRFSTLRRLVHEGEMKAERSHPEWGDLKWLMDNGYAREVRVIHEIVPTDRGRQTAEENRGA